MNLKANLVEKEVWKVIEAEAHKDLFEEELQKKYEKDFRNYSFVVLVSNDEEEMVCYSTVQEIDATAVFLNFGGTFSKFRGKNLTRECLMRMTNRLFEEYSMVGFCCRANNNPMIKVGLDCDYKIIGVQEIYGQPNLEFLSERKG